MGTSVVQITHFHCPMKEFPPVEAVSKKFNWIVLGILISLRRDFSSLEGQESPSDPEIHRFLYVMALPFAGKALSVLFSVSISSGDKADEMSR